MLMIIGWPGAEYGPTAREFLPAALAGLCEKSALSACLAALPRRIEDKEWLLSFLLSVRRVTSIRTGVLVSASIVSDADLVACDASGLNEVVIIQDTADPGAAMESIRGYQQGRHGSTMGIRVWVDEAVVHGGFQAQVCAWKHGTVLNGIELSPFALQNCDPNGSGSMADSQPLSCEWLRSALTVTPAGVVVPCPAHMPKNGHVNAAGSAAAVLARHAALSNTAGSSSMCRSCHRLARYVGADGVASATELRHGMPGFAAAIPQYRDLVGGDARSFSPAEQEAAVARFASRIRALNSEGSS